MLRQAVRPWRWSTPYPSICRVNSRLVAADWVTHGRCWATQRSFSTQTATPLKACVVGSGPSGFYVAKYLLREAQKRDQQVEIDIIDQLPTPYGLVRFGVAPDHPEVKSVQNDFAQVLQQPECRFWGNVSLDVDITVNELRDAYHAVVLCYGASGDKEFGIPGEQLQGVYSARKFVNWYNGHPYFKDEVFDLSGKHAIVLGQGNVALDVARILMKPVAELSTTDITAHSLSALRDSKLTKVSVCGRRGPLEAAFTIKELRELTTLAGSALRVDPDEFDAALVPGALANVPRPQQRKLKLLQEVQQQSTQPCEEPRTTELRFCLQPVEFLASTQDNQRVGGVKFERTSLEQDDSGYVRARGTGQHVVFETDIVFRSIGYKSNAVSGVPFDKKRHVVPTSEGRVRSQDGLREETGLYASGWLKRGPSGIIGTNIVDAKETVSSIVTDIPALVAQTKSGVDGLVALLNERNVKYVDTEGWYRIEAKENDDGARASKPREKIVDAAELLDAAKP